MAAAVVAVANQYRPAPNDECAFRMQPPSLLAQRDATCLLPLNPRFSALRPPEPNPNNLNPELDARSGQLCGRQRPPYRNRNECGRCPANGKQWITRVDPQTGRVVQAVEEEALRIGYDWWLWVDGGERIPGTNTQEPYLSTDPALYNAKRATATALSFDGQFAVSATADGYVRFFNAKTGSIVQVWKNADHLGNVLELPPTKAQIISHLGGDPERRFDFAIVSSKNGIVKVYYSAIADEVNCVLQKADGTHVLFDGDQENNFTDFACAHHPYYRSIILLTVSDADGRLRCFQTPQWDATNERFGAYDRSVAPEIANMFQQDDDAKFTCVTYGPAGSAKVACGSRDGRVFLWTPPNFHEANQNIAAENIFTINVDTLLSPGQQRAAITSVALTINASRLAAGDAQGNVNVWNTVAPFERLYFHRGDGNAVRGIAFSKQSDDLVWVTASNDGNTGTTHIRRADYTPFSFALESAPLPRTLDVSFEFWPRKQWTDQGFGERPYAMIVAFDNERNTVGLYNWNQQNIQQPIFEPAWRGHTSLPIQFVQGATTNEIRTPLPGLPIATFQNRQPSMVNEPETLAELQSRLFGDMRVGRLVVVPPGDEVARSVRPRRAQWPFRFQGDTKFFWRAIQVLDLRQQLRPFVPVGQAPEGERHWPPFFWTKVEVGSVPADVVATFAGLTELQQYGTMSAANKALWKTATDKWPQYYVSEYDENGTRSMGGNFTVWREFRNTVNLKDKWRNIGARRYVRETQDDGCVLNSQQNRIECAQGHGVDAKVYKTTWVTAFFPPAQPQPPGGERGAAAAADIPLLAGGTWAEVVGDTLVFPRVAGGVDITPAMNGRRVTIKIDGRKLQHFAVRKTVELLNRPTTLLTDPLLSNIVGRHPLKPANTTGPQFLASLVGEYEQAARAWSNMAEAEDVHDRRLWQQVAKTLALLEWQAYKDADIAINKMRNWTAIHDMYSRSHSFPFYIVDENGVKLQKFCVIGAKEAARKAKSRGYNVARVQTPRSNLFKKNEWHVYDTCSQPDKEIELYSEKNIPVLEQYTRPAIAIVQESERLPVGSAERHERGFGQQFEIDDIVGSLTFARLPAPPQLPFFLNIDDVLILQPRQQEQQQQPQPLLQPLQPQPPLQPQQPPLQPLLQPPPQPQQPPLRSSTEFVAGELPPLEPPFESLVEPFGSPQQQPYANDLFGADVAQDLNAAAQDFDQFWANFE